MSHRIFRLLSSLFLAVTVSFSRVTAALAAPPANDNFANAQAITSLPFSAAVDNTDATLEPGEPFNCSLSPNTVWYSFPPPQNMAVRADALGGNITGTVALYLSSGPGFANLTFLSCAFGNQSTNITPK